MKVGNETFIPNCRFLSRDDLSLIHKKFIEAFSDYVMPFHLSEAQFRNHIVLNAVDLDLSFGFFENDELVGLSLNGFGMWAGKRTVYDAGTAVVPAFRRRGIGKAMFESMLPIFRGRGFEQCLLEVITTNEPAVKLYESLGFQKTRELLLFEAKQPILNKFGINHAIEIKEIEHLDQERFVNFLDGEPSWQNSFAAIERSSKVKKIFGAFLAGECVGYIAFSAGTGRVAQFAVNKNHRKRGIGTRLLFETQANTRAGTNVRIINIDSSTTAAVEFFQSRGFERILSQYEMVKPL